MTLAPRQLALVARVTCSQQRSLPSRDPVSERSPHRSSGIASMCLSRAGLMCLMEMWVRKQSMSPGSR